MRFLVPTFYFGDLISHFCYSFNDQGTFSDSQQIFNYELVNNPNSYDKDDKVQTEHRCCLKKTFQLKIFTIIKFFQGACSVIAKNQDYDVVAIRNDAFNFLKKIPGFSCTLTSLKNF